MSDVVDFWNERANMGEAAGTNDVVLKRLEIAELVKRVPFGSRVLDVGCGNGITLIALAEKNCCSGIGVDPAPAMIRQAIDSNNSQAVRFQEGRHRSLPDDTFDVSITERCLINLPDRIEQEDAFVEIMSRLKIGGRYFMIENSYDGLAKLNALRALVDLPAMMPPWHNLYFHEEDVRRWETSEYQLEQVVPFTSTYYIVSRVVNARLSADEGKEPQYESPINLLSLKLPLFGDVGATRMWIWRRNR
jgi:SAM-dependent methyltransferase